MYYAIEVGCGMKNRNSFTVRLSDDQLRVIRKIAQRQRRTVSAVVRNLIDDLKKERMRR